MIMKSNRKRGTRTFIEEARRRQILEIALECIAQRGYKSTTLEWIASKAGISKGVIYYHFKTKKELVGQIWTALIDELFQFRKARVDVQTSSKDKLWTYVDAQFQFILDHIKKFIALSEAGFDLTSEDGGNPWSPAINERCFGYLSGILREGQERGEFREHCSKDLAAVIQGAIDGIGLEVIADPDGIDLEGCKRELLHMLEAYLVKK